MDFIIEDIWYFELINRRGECALCMADNVLLYPHHCIACLHELYEKCECCDTFIRKGVVGFIHGIKYVDQTQHAEGSQQML